MAELTEGELNDLLALLASKNFQAFDERVRQLPDVLALQVQLFLGSKDGAAIDIRSLYMEWRDSDQFSASYRLLPVLGSSKAMTAERTAQLARQADLADDVERHLLGAALTKLFTMTPALAPEVGRLIRSLAPPSNAVSRMWAATFANAASGAASQHALDLMDADAGGALSLLKLLSWKIVDVRTVLEPHKERVLAILADAVDRGESDAWDAITEQAAFDANAQRIVMAGLDREIAAAAVAICRSIASTHDAYFGVDKMPLGAILSRLVHLGVADPTVRPLQILR